MSRHTVDYAMTIVDREINIRYPKCLYAAIVLRKQFFLYSSSRPILREVKSGFIFFQSSSTRLQYILILPITHGEKFCFAQTPSTYPNGGSSLGAWPRSNAAYKSWKVYGNVESCEIIIWLNSLRGCQRTPFLPLRLSAQVVQQYRSLVA